MKNYRILASLIAVIAASFAFVGFQCSSAELTSAKLYIQRSEWDKAEEQLQKSLATNPQDEEAWFLLGHVRGQKENYQGMVDAFQHALKISDEHKKDINDETIHYWVGLYNQGTRFLQSGKDTNSYYDKAVVAFKSAIIIEPDSLISYKALAFTYLNMTQEDSAIEPLNVLWGKSKDEDAAVFLGRIYYEKGQKLKTDFENANRDKLASLKDLNSIQEGASTEDVVMAIGQPDQKNNEAIQKGKGKKKTTEPVSSREIWIYKTYGLTLTFDQDKLVGKKVDFVYNPEIDSSKYRSAVAEFKKGLSVLEPAAGLYPEDRDLMTVMSNCYIAAEMTEKATETFRVASMKNPDNADYQYDYGVLLLNANDFESAVVQFKKALDVANTTIQQLKFKLSHPDSSVNVEKLSSDLDRAQSTICSATYNLGASYYNWAGSVQKEARQSNGNGSDSLNKVVNEKIGEALPYAQDYTNCKGDDPNGWEVLGKVYTFLNNKQKADEAFQKADSLRKAQ